MKKFIAYLSMFGAGCATGVLGARFYYKKQFDDRIDAELESIRVAFDKKAEKLKGDIAEKFKEAEALKNDDLLITEVRGLPPEMTRYDTFSKVDDTSPEKADDGRTEHPQEEDYESYFTDVDEFLDESNGYKKLECSYYMDDGVLVGPDGNPVNIFDTVGDDCMEEFQELVDEVCYIRNDKACEDYEVTKVFGAYETIEAEEDY